MLLRRSRKYRSGWQRKACESVEEDVRNPYSTCMQGPKFARPHRLTTPTHTVMWFNNAPVQFSPRGQPGCIPRQFLASIFHVASRIRLVGRYSSATCQDPKSPGKLSRATPTSRFPSKTQVSKFPRSEDLGPPHNPQISNPKTQETTIILFFEYSGVSAVAQGAN